MNRAYNYYRKPNPQELEQRQSVLPKAETASELDMDEPCGPRRVQYVEGPMSREQFEKNFMYPLEPVHMGPAMVTTWPALMLMVDGKVPRWQFWETIRDSPVTLWWDTDKPAAELGLDCHRTEETTLGTFLDILRLHTQDGEQPERPVPGTPYVKDWHLIRDHPELSHIYTTPDVFTDDWLNDYYIHERNDDFRFVYFGSHGSSTDVHSDVYGSHSWSTNILGTKHWTLYRPSDGETLVVDQRAGETVFVPSGWKHSVRNSGITLSINHNWANAASLDNMHAGLADAYAGARHALRDLPASGLVPPGPRLDELVEDVVRASYGWDAATLDACVQRARRS